MKLKLIPLLLILVFTMSCEEPLQGSEDLIGTWTLEAVYDNSKGQGSPISSGDSYSISFFEDGTFTTDKYNEQCTEGSYTADSNYIYLDLPCGVEIENIDVELKENYSYNRKDQLVLAPDYMLCDEGCYYVFNKN